MNDERTDCGSGCDCKPSGLSVINKTIICLLVVLAATAVLGHRIKIRSEQKEADKNPAFATDLSVLKSSGGGSAGGATLWGDELPSLEALNEIASNSDAIFVLLPVKNNEASTAASSLIEKSAGTIAEKGKAIKAYVLKEDSPDYLQIITETPAPCVITLVKGGGSVIVGGEITEKKLIEAYVTALRPSCGPGGCGPDGCK